MCWLVRNCENLKEKRFACCINHVSRIMENTACSQQQLDEITHLCLKNVEGENTNCFSFFPGRYD